MNPCMRFVSNLKDAITDCGFKGGFANRTRPAPDNPVRH